MKCIEETDTHRAGERTIQREAEKFRGRPKAIHSTLSREARTSILRRTGRTRTLAKFLITKP